MSGTATNATNTGITADTATATNYITFVSATTGNLPQKVDTDLTYNPSTNTLAANLSGNVTGNMTGSVSGSVGSVTGNVTGSVGSVTGNVSGNVTGNVTGSVGSVRSITSDLSLNSYRIVGLLDPSANQDASTKKYVDDRGIFGTTTDVGLYTSVKLGYNAVATGTGNKAVAIGFESLKSNTTGGKNIAIGFRSLLNNTTGGQNTSVGSEALNNNLDGSYNVAIGCLALQDSSFNSSNTAVGYNALNNTKSDNNVAIGSSAGLNNIDGSNNTFIGYNTNCNGNFSYSTAIGHDSLITANNQIVLGTGDETVTIPGKLIIPDNGSIGKNDPGIAGQISYNATYIYICTTSSSTPTTPDGVWNRILYDSSWN